MSMPRSLLEIIVEYIFTNFEKYDKVKLNRDLAPFGIAREMLLVHFSRTSLAPDAESNDLNRLWAAMPLLVKSAKCKKLSMHRFWGSNKCNTRPMSNPSLFLEFIQCLPVNTPNLEYLDISTQNRGRIGFAIRSREALSITRLTHLTVLKFTDFTPILMTAFLEIVHQCKNLREVIVRNIHLDAEPPAKELVLEPFNYQRIEFCNKLIKWELRKIEGAELLVYLSIAQYDFKNLRLLKKLTHITTLMVGGNQSNWKYELHQLPLFPRLEFIILNFSDYFNKWSVEAMRRLLQRNGQTLRELQLLMLPPGHMTVGQLFEWCPNLVKLVLLDSTLTESDVSVENLHRLQEVVYASAMCYNDARPSVNFLFDPLKRKICFDTYETTESDVEEDYPFTFLKCIARRQIPQL